MERLEIRVDEVIFRAEKTTAGASPEILILNAAGAELAKLSLGKFRMLLDSLEKLRL